MKRICFTYHMSIDYNKPCDDLPHKIEVAETCVTLPMKDELAEKILKEELECRELKPMGSVGIVLTHISEMQGYHYDGVVSVEEVSGYGH